MLSCYFILLAPPNSRRARVLRRFMNVIFSPFKKIRRNRKLREDIALIRSSGLFDEQWYLANNPDVAQAGVDPACHYLLYGGFESRDPGPNFSSAWYLDVYEDVKKAGTNPLVHYLKYGREEGRTAQKGTKNLEVNNYYKEWITRNEPGETELITQRNSSKLFSYCPLISIIVPIINTPEVVLRETIDSVINQTYPNWQLCISSGDQETVTSRQLLKKYAEIDRRIHLIPSEKNLGIARNTNAAITIANGEYVAFLDHNDCLAPFALFEVVGAINDYPQTDLIYSDEDKLSVDGKQRYDPHFKSAFNIELLRCVNYMGHFLVIRKTIGDGTGWLRERFEGATDFDLILRVIEKAQWVTHIPKILYHWRAIASYPADEPGAKSSATNSGIRALREHLKRLGISGLVTQAQSAKNYQIKYSIPGNPMISIVIPNHDHANDLRRCMESILKKTSYSNYEIMIIENGSLENESFKLYEALKRNPRIQVIEYHQLFNFSQINNFAIKKVSGDVVLLLNNDTEVINSDWLERMLEYVIQPEVGIVGAKLYYPDDTLQHGGIALATDAGIAGHLNKFTPSDSPGYYCRTILPQNLSAVTAACMMMSKDVFNQVLGFDEKYQLAFGDVDLCMKVREKGYLIVWTPYAELYHYESSTRGYEDTPEKDARLKIEAAHFREKWHSILEQGDPYYNPNFNANGNYDFSIASNPNNLHVRCLPVHQTVKARRT